MWFVHTSHWVGTQFCQIVDRTTLTWLNQHISLTVSWLSQPWWNAGGVNRLRESVYNMYCILESMIIFACDMQDHHEFNMFLNLQS